MNRISTFFSVAILLLATGSAYAQTARSAIAKDSLRYERVPDPDAFVPNAILPQVDMRDLQRHIRYPELALRNNIEGKVEVQVLVDTVGRVIKTRVLKSVFSMFEQAALDGVRATTFTPGTLNGHPILLWVTVPVMFVLAH